LIGRAMHATSALLRAAVIAALVAAVPARAAEKVTYVDNVLPVLRQRCGSCHNPDKKTGGLDITSYAAVMRGGGSGEVIAAGSASGSYLYRVANHDDEPKMPPDAPPIPEAERQLIKAWIDGGVLETKGSVAVAPKKVEVAMAAPATERPAVQPMPAHLPLEPAVHTKAVDACAAVATSPWSPLVAVCGQKQILLYRTDSLELAGVLPFPEGRPHVVRFSAGGGLVVAGGGVGGQSGRAAVWSVRNGRRIRTVGEELDAVLAADVSPDQRLVAIGGPQKVVRVYSLETGEKLHDLGKHTDWILAAAFSPDGALLATADRGGNVMVWEAATGRDFLALQAHPAAVTTLAWRGDSNVLATGCDDGQIRLWELENGTQVKAWAAHGGGVATLDFTRDGRIVSTGRDKTPKLWKADSSQERAFEASADVGLATAFCDETNRLVVGDWTGELRVFNAADGSRIGSLDPNPPALADRVADAERGLADRKARLDAAVAAVAAAPDAEKSKLEQQVVDLKNGMAQAGAAHARWLAEVAFQANYDRLAKVVTERQAAVASAEGDWGTAEAARREAEQGVQAVVAKQEAARKKVEELAAKQAQMEREAAELAGRIEKRGGELAAVQATIEKALQALAALEESVKPLEKVIAATPDDAAIKQAVAGLATAKQTKQAEVKQQQDALAGLMAERAAWEKSLGDKRAEVTKLGAEVNAAKAAVPSLDPEMDAAKKKLDAAAKVVDEKRAVITARQADVDAAAKELDTLQGAG
jgi:hypothetical protein